MSQIAQQTVCSHRILGQVVGADRHEINLTQNRLGVHGCGGGFNHHAVYRQANLLEHFREIASLGGGRNHWGHHPDIGVGILGCLLDSLQLAGQHARYGPVGAETAHAQRRVFLGVHVQEGQRLVGARIQGANHDVLAGEGIKHRLISFCLGFNRRLGIVPQEAELGAQQTHAFGVQAGSLLSGFAVAHVRVEWHAGAVGEHAFTVEFGDRFAVSVFFSGFAVFIGRLGIDDTRVRVHIDLGAVWNIGNALRRHDRGKTQAARQNRGMRLRAAV